MKKNTWEKVVWFFNLQRELGPAFQRVCRQRFIGDKLFKKDSLTLIETYRCYLTRAGYLKHIGLGLYEITRTIPWTLTSKECYRRAYPKVTNETTQTV